MLHAIIMAGGTGTRFWPASTKDTPKQLLQLVGDASLVRQTVDRLGDVAPAGHRLIVTNKRLLGAIHRAIAGVTRGVIRWRTVQAHTAPCIGLAAMLVSRHDPEATMVVMPADHVIGPSDVFQDAIRQAAQMVDDSPWSIVTFGIKPTYPAEVFGYIRRGRPLPEPEGAAPAYVVKKFEEKPDAAKAAKYLATGEYYWNSGIFVWRAATILSALAERQPVMVRHLETILAAWDTDERNEVFEREFTAIQPVSIDYAVMEHATDVAVIEAPFEWDDLGSWQSLARLEGTDAEGNTIIGRHMGVRTKGTIVHTDDEHLVVTLGLEDCIVVHTPNATLVANKHDEEQIRQVVKELEKRGWIEYL